MKNEEKEMRRILLIMIAFSVWMLADTARYTRSDTGIVTDNKTGLQWQDDYSDNGDTVKSAKWTDAIIYCEGLSLGGHDDWRLPNFNELYYLADRSRVNPAIDPAFQNAHPGHYWSSTSYYNARYAKFVHFYYGSDYYGYDFNKSHSLFVRCVRAGE